MYTIEGEYGIGVARSHGYGILFPADEPEIDHRSRYFQFLAQPHMGSEVKAKAPVLVAFVKALRVEAVIGTVVDRKQGEKAAGRLNAEIGLQLPCIILRSGGNAQVQGCGFHDAQSPQEFNTRTEGYMVFPLVGISNAGFPVMACTETKIESKITAEVIAAVAVYQKAEKILGISKTKGQLIGDMSGEAVFANAESTIQPLLFQPHGDKILLAKNVDQLVDVDSGRIALPRGFQGIENIVQVESAVGEVKVNGIQCRKAEECLALAVEGRVE